MRLPTIAFALNEGSFVAWHRSWGRAASERCTTTGGFSERRACLLGASCHRTHDAQDALPPVPALRIDPVNSLLLHARRTFAIAQQV